MYNEVLQALQQVPLFRERRNRSHYLMIMALRYAESAKVANSGVKLTATHGNTGRKPNPNSPGVAGWDAWEKALKD